MILRNDETLQLEDAYHDWQQCLYDSGDQDSLDKLEKSYYEIFEKISVQPDFWSNGLEI